MIHKLIHNSFHTSVDCIPKTLNFNCRSVPDRPYKIQMWHMFRRQVKRNNDHMDDLYNLRPMEFCSMNSCSRFRSNIPSHLKLTPLLLSQPELLYFSGMEISDTVTKSTLSN